jgi:hypothetical protein
MRVGEWAGSVRDARVTRPSAVEVPEWRRLGVSRHAIVQTAVKGAPRARASRAYCAVARWRQVTRGAHGAKRFPRQLRWRRNSGASTADGYRRQFGGAKPTPYITAVAGPRLPSRVAGLTPTPYTDVNTLTRDGRRPPGRREELRHPSGIQDGRHRQRRHPARPWQQARQTRLHAQPDQTAAPSGPHV